MLAPAAASSMRCNTLSSSCIRCSPKATLGSRDLCPLFPLQLAQTLTPPAHLQLPAASSHPQLHRQSPAQPSRRYAKALPDTSLPQILVMQWTQHPRQPQRSCPATLITREWDSSRWHKNPCRQDGWWMRSLQALIHRWFCQGPLSTLPRCPGWKTNDLSAQPHHFPVGLLGEEARIQLLGG